MKEYKEIICGMKGMDEEKGKKKERKRVQYEKGISLFKERYKTM